MTNAKALKDLYVALGGSLSDVYDAIAPGVPVEDYAVSSDCIAALALLVQSGETKELPAVTGEDKGALLTVARDGSSADPNAYSWQTTPLDTVADVFEADGYHFLPAADSSDAGKIPVVQPDGSYTLAETGGGAKIAFVHLNPAGDEYKAAYETAQQILTLFNANDFLFVTVGLDTSHKYGLVYDCQESNGKIDIFYSCWQNSTTANDSIYGASPTDSPAFAGFQV